MEQLKRIHTITGGCFWFFVIGYWLKSSEIVLLPITYNFRHIVRVLIDFPISVQASGSPRFIVESQLSGILETFPSCVMHTCRDVPVTQICCVAASMIS
jgi:hypothetical protein